MLSNLEKIMNDIYNDVKTNLKPENIKERNYYSKCNRYFGTRYNEYRYR